MLKNLHAMETNHEINGERLGLCMKTLKKLRSNTLFCTRFQEQTRLGRLVKAEELP